MEPTCHSGLRNRSLTLRFNNKICLYSAHHAEWVLSPNSRCLRLMPSFPLHYGHRACVRKTVFTLSSSRCPCPSIVRELACGPGIRHTDCLSVFNRGFLSSPHPASVPSPDCSILGNRYHCSGRSNSQIRRYASAYPLQLEFAFAALLVGVHRVSMHQTWPVVRPDT